MTKQDVDIENLLKKIYDDKLAIEKDKEQIEKNLNQVAILKNNLQTLFPVRFLASSPKHNLFS